MKRLTKIFLILVSVLVLLLGILFLASKFIERKIIEKAITILNNELEVPVQIDNISFSLFKQFPQASLQLSNVTIFSSANLNKQHFTESFTDTLLFIHDLYLSVNLRSLRDNRLDVTQAWANHGQVNFLIDKNGNENFRIFKNNPDTLPKAETKKSLAFLLNQIQLNQIEFRFINKFKNTAISIYAPVYTLKGEFFKSDYTAVTSGKLLLNYFYLADIKLHPRNPGKISLNVNVSNNVFEIAESTFDSKEFQFSINGSVNMNEPIKLDLKIKGTTDNLDSFIGLIAGKNAKSYSTKGNLAIAATLKGVLDNKHNPAVSVNFNLTNGSIRNNENDMHISRIDLLGKYTNGTYHNIKTSSIDIEKFYLVVDNSNLTGKFSMTNFADPKVSLSAKTSLQLADFKPLFPTDGSFFMDGKLDGDFNCQGSVNTKNEITLASFQHWEKQASLSISNGVFKMKKPQLNISNLSGQVEIANNNLTLNRLVGLVQSSNMKADAYIDDYYSVLLDSMRAVNVIGSVKADQVKYADFEQFFETDENAPESRDYNFKGPFETAKCYYDNIVAEKVTGYMDYFNEEMRVTNLKFTTMEGLVSGNVNYLPRGENKYLFQTHCITNHVNIKTLFTAYNNFEQTFITDANIDGYLTSDFDFEMLYIGDDYSLPSIEMMGHARIDNGKLVNFEPIHEISKYSDIEEIENIKFSKLENDILISNSTVHIPKMDISSNAFDMTLYGTQHFSGNFEYHLQLNLSDFLGGKSKRLAKQNSEFGIVEDDGNNKYTLFLIATYVDGITNVKLDGDQIKGRFKQNAKNEKKEIKKALNQEFGWFKKDSTLQEPEKKPKKPAFEIQWDEE